ncbi:MAG TPA: ATP-binding cassette domain-containing protein [Chloroflexota bacterium]
MPIIAATDLTKIYRYHQKEPGLRGSLASLLRRRTLERIAVDGVSFRIEPGEIVGFLGPNGAGTTTTLKMLSGLLYPSRGQARVLGYEPVRREHPFLRRIALVTGQRGMLWWDIPAMEALLVQRDLYAVPGPEFRRSLAELAEMLEVEQLLRVQVRKLSLGERMKMELLAALIYRPEVVFLDEPTIGLDLVSQQRVRDFLRRLNRQQGTTILLTSHYMDDIEQLCPRVLLIDHGRLRFDGPLARLVEQAAPHKVVTAVFVEPPEPAALAQALGRLEPRPGDDPRRLSLTVPRPRAAELAGRLLALGDVADLSVEDEPVEEIVRGLFAASRGADVAPDGAPDVAVDVAANVTLSEAKDPHLGAGADPSARASRPDPARDTSAPAE